SSQISARATDMPRWPKGPAVRFETPKPAAVAMSRPATVRNGMYFLLPSVNRRNVTCSFLGTAPPLAAAGPRPGRVSQRQRTVPRRSSGARHALVIGQMSRFSTAELGKCLARAVYGAMAARLAGGGRGDAPGAGLDNGGVTLASWAAVLRVEL